MITETKCVVIELIGGKVAQVGLAREREMWSDPYGPQSMKGKKE